MGKIFCLMGKSSSGKDTIYKELLRNKKIPLKKIVSYTTRPIRAGEEDGVQYFFRTEEDVRKLEAENKIIELRTYDTCHGPWKYFTVKDHQIDLAASDYLVIGTPESFVSMREYFGKDIVIPIYIDLDDGLRLQRALDRERSQEEPKYEEMCRRFLADAKDFSAEKMQKYDIKESFYNDNLEHCLDEIESFMMAKVK